QTPRRIDQLRDEVAVLGDALLRAVALDEILQLIKHDDQGRAERGDARQGPEGSHRVGWVHRRCGPNAGELARIAVLPGKPSKQRAPLARLYEGQAQQA